MRTQRTGWIGHCFVLACALSCSQASRADDPPTARAVVEQAIAAQGGKKALETIGASIVASKGNLTELGKATFRAETFSQLPNQYRLVMNVDTDGLRIPYIDVLNGERAWNRTNNDPTETVDGPTLTEMRLEQYVNFVSSLLPLLRDEGFTLSSESRQPVNNAPAAVVLVRKKDKPDIRLFFDVQSHYLVKVEHTRFDHEKGKDAHFEEYPQDYRVVDLVGDDRKLLTAAKMATNAAALKAFLRKQMLDPGEQKLVQAQIKALGDDKFTVREEAKNALIKLGPRVIGLLEAATHSGDPEIASRARECLQGLGKGPSPELLGAAIRLFAFERDKDALEVLLAYLPSAGDETVAKEVRSALAALAAGDPKGKDRLIAAGKSGDPELSKAIAPMLTGTGALADISYRVYPAGVKQAMKGMKLRNGTKTVDWETTEIRYYHSLPAALFAKP